MYYLSVAARWLFILCLPFLLLTASVAWAANSPWLYENGFKKYDISNKTGLAQSELEKTARGLISYWNSSEELIDITVEKDGETFNLFKQHEIAHLKDVKGLFRLDYAVLLAALLFTFGYSGFALYNHRRRSLARSLMWGSGITLMTMLALWVGSLVGFDRLFLQFHLLSFSNDFWQLDPTRDYLIMLFPQGFWYDVTLFCALVTAVLAVIVGGASGIYLFLTRKT